MSRIRGLLPDTDNGRALLLGLVLLAAGLLLAWPPAALIVPGALLVFLSFRTPPSGPEGDA